MVSERHGSRTFWSLCAAEVINPNVSGDPASPGSCRSWGLPNPRRIKKTTKGSMGVAESSANNFHSKSAASDHSESIGNTSSELVLNWFKKDAKPRFLISSKLDILLCNDSASSIFDKKAGISIKRGQLWCSDRKQNERISDFFSNSKLKVGNLLLEQADQSRILLRAEKVCGGAEYTFGVTLYFPISDHFAQISSLAQYFGLTPMEARVAHQIIVGETTQRASENLGCSFETVRTHTKNIYRKLSISRRNDLLRLAYLFNEAS